MNKFGLTHLGAMIPQQVFHLCQSCAAREGIPLPVWVRRALFKAAEVSETDIKNMPAPVIRLTPARRAILTFLESNAGFQTTGAIAQAMSLAQQTVYNTLSDLRREGMILRGENVSTGNGAGAPYKAYTISDLGKSALTRVRDASKVELEELNARTIDSYARVTAPIRAQADQDQYRERLHADLKYIAMHRLGRSLESEADLEWLATEHARLCDRADADVSEGKATFEAHASAVRAKIESLGGTALISDRFNIGQ